MATPPQSAATADFLWLWSRFGATADLPALFGMFFCCSFLLRTYKYSLLIYVPNDLLPCSPSEGGLQVGTFPSEGMQNQEARPTTARYKGVRLRKWGKWVAEVRFPNSSQRLWLGSYPTPEMAARAYDAAVYCLRGPGAALNFPSHPPSIPSADKLSKYEIREAAARHAREGPQPQQAEEAGKRAADPGAGSSGLGATSGQPAEPSSSVPVFEDATASGGDCFEGFWHDGGGGIDDDDIYGLSPLWNFQ